MDAIRQNFLAKTGGAASNLESVFGEFDLDKDGSVTLEEFRQVNGKLGSIVSDAEAEQMFKAADTDNDGKLSFAEFSAFLKG